MKDRWMRRIPILAMIALLGVVSCAASDNDGHMDAEASASGEAVIVYFSATGNTRAVAEELSKITGAPIVEIIPEEIYTETDLDYRNTDSRAYRESHDDSARPAIKPLDADIIGYGTIFLGFPIWFGDMPKVLYSFLDEYDLSGKDIAPFCTSGGSGITTAVRNIAEMEGDADVLDGLRVSAGNPRSALVSWLTAIGSGEH